MNVSSFCHAKKGEKRCCKGLRPQLSFICFTLFMSTWNIFSCIYEKKLIFVSCCYPYLVQPAQVTGATCSNSFPVVSAPPWAYQQCHNQNNAKYSNMIAFKRLISLEGVAKHRNQRNELKISISNHRERLPTSMWCGISRE